MCGLTGNPSVASGDDFIAFYGCGVYFRGAELAGVADKRLRLFTSAEHLLHLLLTDPGARHASRLTFEGAMNDRAAD